MEVVTLSLDLQKEGAARIVPIGSIRRFIEA